MTIADLDIPATFCSNKERLLKTSFMNLHPHFYISRKHHFHLLLMGLPFQIKIYFLEGGIGHFEKLVYMYYYHL